MYKYRYGQSEQAQQRGFFCLFVCLFFFCLFGVSYFNLFVISCFVYFCLFGGFLSVFFLFTYERCSECFNSPVYARNVAWCLVFPDSYYGKHGWCAESQQTSAILICWVQNEFNHLKIFHLFSVTDRFCGGDGSVFCFVYLVSKFYSKVEPN